MKLSDFDYFLPKELVAQNALPERGNARLLVLDRGKQSIEDRIFREIGSFFRSGDVLVLNDTRVLTARLFAAKKSGGRIEILVLRRINGPQEVWQVLVKPSRRVKKGEELEFEGQVKLNGQVLDEPDGQTGIRRMRFVCDRPFEEALEMNGHIPLPPYIDRPDHPVDRQLYQTVFAKVPGAVASPTAGLHFDGAILDALRATGVEIVFVTLHVGYGTFQPVDADDFSTHRMHEEFFQISQEAAERINSAKSGKRRVIACGTTVVRVLETVASRQADGQLTAAGGETNLFIYPPYSFRIVDGMITNFHLPKTTLLMLVSAFAGHEFLMDAYREAIRRRYRFYSYGDAMMIV